LLKGFLEPRRPAEVAVSKDTVTVGGGMHTASLVHDTHISAREALRHSCFDVRELCLFARLSLKLSLIEESLHGVGSREPVFRQFGGHDGRVSWDGNVWGNDWN
jgi:hypothetical protein